MFDMVLNTPLKKILKRSAKDEVYQNFVNVFTAKTKRGKCVERNQKHFLKDSYEMS